MPILEGDIHENVQLRAYFLELQSLHQPSIKDVQVKQSEAIAEGFIAALK